LDFIGQRIRIRIGNPGSDLDRPNWGPGKEKKWWTFILRVWTSFVNVYGDIYDGFWLKKFPDINFFQLLS
jgi:hypothetical protein